MPNKILSLFSHVKDPNHNDDTIKPVSSRSSRSSKSLSTSSRSSSTSKLSDTQSTVVSSSTNNTNVNSGRFILAEDSHVHRLKPAHRQEKLGSMLNNLLRNNKKLRDEAVSAVPDLALSEDLMNGLQQNQPKNQLSMMSRLVSAIERGEKDVKHVVRNAPTTTATTVTTTTTTTTSSTNIQNEASFLQKYGKLQGVIGKGSFGVVRLSERIDSKTKERTYFAIKDFKKKADESPDHYNKRLTTEFCISASLHHPNIISTFDLMKDIKGDFCVMEYCAGGDLYSLILSTGESGLEPSEANCMFKQIMRGVLYMHNMGIAHCDLKPENILLTRDGCCKISDFGNSECFKMAWEEDVHPSHGLCGSTPYIAPEEYITDEFDPRPVDIWSCGIIYMSMRTGHYMWTIAKPSVDKFYQSYLNDRKKRTGYAPIESLKSLKCRNVIYSMLDPNPITRLNGKEVLNSEWVRSIKVCEAGNKKIN